MFVCWSCVSFALESINLTKPFLHPLFSDGMVIQQDQEVLIWGWAETGTSVKVELADQSVQSMVGDNGKWQARLLPLASGNTYQMRVASDKEQVTVSDIQVGEVWLCSGQSNMFWPVAKTDQAELALADADNPSIRLFNINPHYAASEQQNFSSYIPWQKATTHSVEEFSAVCYFFGKALQQTLKVPVGLIHASWGGTKIEAWTGREVLLKQGHFAKKLSKFDEYVAKSNVVIER
jgi:sialate O-acetylesterase